MLQSLKLPYRITKASRLQNGRTKRTLVKVERPQNVSCSGHGPSPRLEALSRGREGSDVDAVVKKFSMTTPQGAFKSDLELSAVLLNKPSQAEVGEHKLASRIIIAFLKTYRGNIHSNEARFQDEIN